MRRFNGTVMFVACLLAGPAHAADAISAQLGWSLPFGGSEAVGTPALALGIRPASVPDVAGDLVELSLRAAGPDLRVAGVPLTSAPSALGQNDALEPAPAARKPWYARAWVLWTVGGLAATAALTGGAGGDPDGDHCTGTCNQNDTGPNTSINGVGDEGAACVGDTCAVCRNGDIASDCDWEGDGLLARGTPVLAAGDPARDAWLDAGTGHMGDLAAR